MNFPDAALTDLRQRVFATRWPDRETVSNATQGVQLATLKALAHYWTTSYDWRKVEARLNALPMFITKISGLDIHFIHVRSKHEHALPLIITHGWPGSIIEQMKMIEPLTNPTAHGGTACGRFPCRYSLAAWPRLFWQADGAGMDPRQHRPRMGNADAAAGLHEVCGARRRLGKCYLGDNGAAAAAGIAGHPALTWRPRFPRFSKALSAGAPPPAGLSADEKRAWDQLDDFQRHGLAYAQEMANRPQTLYGLADSPVGLAAWMLDHDIRSYLMITRIFSGGTEGLTRDDILENISLYWLTNTGSPRPASIGTRRRSRPAAASSTSGASRSRSP